MIPILYNSPHCLNTEGQHGKSNQCASAASCGAARSAVARREVRPSDFCDRVAKCFRNIPERKPTNPNYFGSFTTENGAGAKGEMGKDSERTAANSRCSQNNGLHSCEAYDLGGRPQEDRGGAAGTLGEGEGRGEEGGLEPAEPITRIVLHRCLSEEYQQLGCLSSMPFVAACAPVHSSGRLTFPSSKGWPVRFPRSHFLA